MSELRTDQEVSAEFRVEHARARIWLDRAVDEGRAERIGSRPSRYQRTRARLF